MLNIPCGVMPIHIVICHDHHPLCVCLGLSLSPILYLLRRRRCCYPLASSANSGAGSNRKAAPTLEVARLRKRRRLLERATPAGPKIKRTRLEGVRNTPFYEIVCSPNAAAARRTASTCPCCCPCTQEGVLTHLVSFQE